MSDAQREGNHLGQAAHKEAEREALLARDPEPSLARRFGQIGILGWMIVIPVLVAYLSAVGSTGCSAPASRFGRRIDLCRRGAGALARLSLDA
jgi:hypothetical protein